MVVKKKAKKEEKVVKGKKKVEEEEEEESSGGMGLDDAFGDDEDVEYAESKPRKVKTMKDLEEDEDEAEEEVAEMNSKDTGEPVEIKASKPISKVKKGDKVNIDGIEMTVDAHYVLIDHGSTKEMTVELYDSKDGEYQLRYFDDQVESTLELYELKEIMYLKRAMRKIEW